MVVFNGAGYKPGSRSVIFPVIGSVFHRAKIIEHRDEIFTLVPVAIKLVPEPVFAYPSLRARPKITSHFRISSSCHLRPILIRKILEIVLLFLWFCAIGSSKSKTNLSANSVKLFLGEP